MSDTPFVLCAKCGQKLTCYYQDVTCYDCTYGKVAMCGVSSTVICPKCTEAPYGWIPRTTYGKQVESCSRCSRVEDQPDDAFGGLDAFEWA